jgi:hypothetical protein
MSTLALLATESTIPIVAWRAPPVESRDLADPERKAE